jgi:hypothetical protein
MGRRFGLHEACLWERITVLTRGRLLSLAPDC